MIFDAQPKFATFALRFVLTLLLSVSLLFSVSTSAQGATLAELPGDWEPLDNTLWDNISNPGASNPFGNWTWGNLTGAGGTFAPALDPKA